MNSEPTTTIENTPPAPNLANFGLRFVAIVIDLGFIVAAYLFLMLALHSVLLPDLMQGIERVDEEMNAYRESTGSGPSEPFDPNIVFSEESRNFIGRTNQMIFLTMVPLLFIYFAGFEIFLKGSSPGKKVFNLRVYSLQTRGMATRSQTYWRGAIKTASIILSITGLVGMGLMGLIFFLAIVFLPALNRRRQALHDYIAKSLVLQDRVVLLNPTAEESR